MNKRENETKQAYRHQDLLRDSVSNRRMQQDRDRLTKWSKTSKKHETLSYKGITL